MIIDIETYGNLLIIRSFPLHLYYELKKCFSYTLVGFDREANKRTLTPEILGSGYDTNGQTVDLSTTAIPAQIVTFHGYLPAILAFCLKHKIKVEHKITELSPAENYVPVWDKIPADFEFRYKQKEVLELMAKNAGGIIVCSVAFGKSELVGIMPLVFPKARILISSYRAQVYSTIGERIRKYNMPGTKYFIQQAGKSITQAQVKQARVVVCGNKSLTKILSFGEDYDFYICDECFTGDTEVLTNKGYKRFDSLDGTELIAQWSADRSIQFVKPLRHIKKEFSGDLVKLTLYKGRSVRMTVGHNQTYLDRQDNVCKKPILDIVRAQYNKYPVSGIGVNEIATLAAIDRLAIALQADGTRNYVKRDYAYWSISLVKERKILRLKEILLESGVEFKEIPIDREGYVRFVIKTPLEITKNLITWFNNVAVTRAYAVDFVNEVSLWDGYILKKDYQYYSSSVKENVDLVSAIAIQGGFSCVQSIQKDYRKESYQDMHRLFMSKKEHNTFKNVTHELEKYSGNVYCVEVPSGNIVVRSEGFSFISGNCHLAAAPDTFKTISTMVKPRIFGLTGSFNRSDGAQFRLLGLMGPKLITVDTKEATKQGMVAPVKVKWVPVHLQYNPVGKCHSAYKKHRGIWYNAPRNNLIAAAAKSYDEDTQVLIIVETIKHAMALRQLLPNYLVVSSETPDLDRARGAFKKGTLKRVIATAIWREGVDFPNLAVLINACGLKSEVANIQLTGRVARLGDDKPYGVVHDFYDYWSTEFKHFSAERKKLYEKQGYEQTEISAAELLKNL